MNFILINKISDLKKINYYKNWKSSSSFVNYDQTDKMIVIMILLNKQLINELLEKIFKF